MHYEIDDYNTELDVVDFLLVNEISELRNNHPLSSNFDECDIISQKTIDVLLLN